MFAREVEIDVLNSSEDEGHFFVGTMPELSKAYFVRSVLHHKKDFIIMLALEAMAQKVVRYMNARPSIFHGWDTPMDLAAKIESEREAGRLVL